MTIWNFILVLLIIWFVNTVIIIRAERMNADVEMIAAYCACGIWAVIINSIAKLYEIICRKYKRKHYKAILLDPCGRVCYTESDCVDRLIDEYNYKWADYIRDKYTIEDGFDPNNCVMKIPNLRYTPMKIIKAENAYEIDYKKVEGK